MSSDTNIERDIYIVAGVLGGICAFLLFCVIMLFAEINRLKKKVEENCAPQFIGRDPPIHVPGAGYRYDQKRNSIYDFRANTGKPFSYSNRPANVNNTFHNNMHNVGY